MKHEIEEQLKKNRIYIYDTTRKAVLTSAPAAYQFFQDHDPCLFNSIIAQSIDRMKSREVKSMREAFKFFSEVKNDPDKSSTKPQVRL